jgi:hypothetical protein
MAYGLFIVLLPAGFEATIVTSACFGLFSMIQLIVTFTQLMKFLNRIKPTSVLTGTSVQSMSQQLLHSFVVFCLTHLLRNRKDKGKDLLVFLLIFISILLTNFCAWSLNRMLKKRDIDLDAAVEDG